MIFSEIRATNIPFAGSAGVHAGRGKSRDIYFCFCRRDGGAPSKPQNKCSLDRAV